MTVNIVIYSILSITVIALMLSFFLPFAIHLLPQWPWAANTLCALLTILAMSPFLRAMVVKKNHSEEFKALWAESRLNHLPLMFTILVRVVIASSFVFYVVNYLSRFGTALAVAIAISVITLFVLSRGLKRRSIMLERMFMQNLRSRDIDAQMRGRKRPLYAGHLLDRNIHISFVDVPADSNWIGRSLQDLAFRQRFGVHVCSIFRANRRINIPTADEQIFPYDRLQVMGDDRQLSKLAEAMKSEVNDLELDIRNREMNLRQMVINGTSPLLGVSLRDSGIRDRHKCMVIGLEEGKERLSPIAPARKFRKGDIVWIVGEEENLKELEEMKE